MRISGVVLVVMMFGCEQQETRPARSSQNAQQEGSSVDPNAMSPERADAIERLFARKAGELQACWTDEYERTHNRKLEGDVSLQLMISPSGKPTDVKVTRSSMNNESLEGCVTKTVKEWHFPEGASEVPYTRTVHLGAQF
jgi:TonB family protein